ncbi:unnamed protein product, partial [Urochloa humidicola]
PFPSASTLLSPIRRRRHPPADPRRPEPGPLRRQFRDALRRRFRDALRHQIASDAQDPMAPGQKRGTTKATPAAGQQPPPSGAPGDGVQEHPGKGGALQMGSAARGRPPMKRSCPAFSGEVFEGQGLSWTS